MYTEQDPIFLSAHDEKVLRVFLDAVSNHHT